jgi:hypothetical protein
MLIFHLSYPYHPDGSTSTQRKGLLSQWPAMDTLTRAMGSPYNTRLCLADGICDWSLVDRGWWRHCEYSGVSNAVTVIACNRPRQGPKQHELGAKSWRDQRGGRWIDSHGLLQESFVVPSVRSAWQRPFGRVHLTPAFFLRFVLTDWLMIDWWIDCDCQMRRKTDWLTDELSSRNIGFIDWLNRRDFEIEADILLMRYWLHWTQFVTTSLLCEYCSPSKLAVYKVWYVWKHKFMLICMFTIHGRLQLFWKELSSFTSHFRFQRNSLRPLSSCIISGYWQVWEVVKWPFLIVMWRYYSYVFTQLNPEMATKAHGMKSYCKTIAMCEITRWRVRPVLWKMSLNRQDRMEFGA